MFVTRESNELNNESTYSCQANSRRWHTIHLEPLKGFCLATWGSGTQAHQLMADTHILHNTMQESGETPLMSLAIFLPSEDFCVQWTVHNIVKVWQCYCIEEDRHVLIFENDTGEKSPNTDAQTLINEKVIWTSPAYSSCAVQ
jgi:hypothetical protein